MEREEKQYYWGIVSFQISPVCRQWCKAGACVRWLYQHQHQYLALWRCGGRPNQMTSSPTAFRGTGETWTLADHPTTDNIKLAYITIFSHNREM